MGMTARGTWPRGLWRLRTPVELPDCHWMQPSLLCSAGFLFATAQMACRRRGVWLETFATDALLLCRRDAENFDVVGALAEAKSTHVVAREGVCRHNSDRSK
jgi:hypothetical protein